MEYKRLIKYQYCVVRCMKQKNGEWRQYRKFDLVEVISKIKKDDLLMKSIELDGLLARVDKISHDKKHDIWGIRFMKLRDTNIPSKVKENKEAEVIPLDDDEYIGEDVTMIFEKKSGIAMIQSNRFSLNIDKIAKLMNLLYENENVIISIDPIIEVKNDTRLKKCYYKTIDLSFANLKLWGSQDHKKLSLNSLISPVKKLGGYSGHVTIGLGHTKETTLDRTATQELVNEIKGNKKFFRSAKVKIKDDDDSNMEIIDLFEEVYHDFIEFILEKRKALEYKSEVKSMIQQYEKRKANLYKEISYKNGAD